MTSGLHSCVWTMPGLPRLPFTMLLASRTLGTRRTCRCRAGPCRVDLVRCPTEHLIYLWYWYYHYHYICSIIITGDIMPNILSIGAQLMYVQLSYAHIISPTERIYWGATEFCRVWQGFFWLSSWASCEGPWFAPGGVWKLGPGWQLRIWKVWSTERHTLLKISDGFLGCSWKFHDCLLIPLRNWTWIFCLLLGMQITSIVQAQAGRGNSRGQLAPSWRGAISPWKVKTSPHACVWKWGYPPKHYAWGV